MQPAEAMAVEAPYRPAAHALHVAAPARLNLPAGQVVAVAVVLPEAQEYPALHGPVHVDAVRPVVAPYRPGSQGPEHAAVDSPVEAP